MITLLKNGHLLAPDDLGGGDVLMAAGKILAVEETIDPPVGIGEVETVDAAGKFVAPGFVDSHVHIIGGGGEGGYRTRTPEIQLSDITSGGVTTLVGVIGTDGTTRTMAALVAKARALREEGVTCYAYTGNYHLPTRTLTGTVEDDILLVDVILGAGEIAISDHRSCQPTLEELAKLASSARIGGMLSGKAGIVNTHLGDGADMLEPLISVSKHTEVPITQFLPTHINRNPDLFEAGIEYALRGGYVDFTTSTTPKFLEEGEVECGRAVRRMLDAGVPLSRLTMSSDAQGSLPEFDAGGNFAGLGVGRVASLYEAMRDAVREEGLPLADALRTITSNPAGILKLDGKGRLSAGVDADAVLLDRESLQVTEVVAGGRVMVRDGEVVVRGTFE